MHIDLWTLGLQTVNAVVLVWILARFLFRPVAAIVAARQAEAARLLAEAAAARDAAAAAQAQAEEETTRLAAGRAEALKAAQQEAETARAALLDAARSDADHVRAAAQDELARARTQDATVAGARASQLAVDIATRLLTRLPESARIAGFIEGLAAAVAALPAAERAGLAAEGTLKLRAARALSEAEAQACRTRLGEALGHDVTLDVVADPALLAGLEIETPHAAVRNSLRADLQRIAAELARPEDAAHDDAA